MHSQSSGCLCLFFLFLLFCSLCMFLAVFDLAIFSFTAFCYSHRLDPGTQHDVGVSTAWAAPKYAGVHTLAATSRLRKHCTAFVLAIQGGTKYCQPDQWVIIEEVKQLGESWSKITLLSLWTGLKRYLSCTRRHLNNGHNLAICIHDGRLL